MTTFVVESLELRQKLAYACRILAANGQNDAVYGHVTHRLSSTDTCWMKPATIGLDEMTPDAAICIDLDGNVLAGELPSGGGRKGRLSFRVTISITSLHHGTEAMVNILDLAANGEGATRSDGNLPLVGSLLRAAGDNGSHDIARLKSIRLTVRFGPRAREAVLIHATHLASLPAGRGNEERDDACDVQRLGRACCDTRGIQPVRFRQSPARAIPLRAPARTDFNRKSQRLQATVEFPPCRVHGCGVLERGLCLGLETLQAFRLVRKKVLDELRPL